MVAMSKTNSLPSPEKLESELLRTFLAVAEAGSFTRGADRIFRSQSAASLQIKRLESLLGQPVFERHGRGVALTPVGERLRPVAQSAVQLLDGALAELKSNRLEGSIVIAIPDEYGETILPQVIARFARDHPNVELAVQCASSAGFPQALERGELDVAVYDAESADPNSILLRRQKTFWVRSRHHLVHEHDPLPLALFDRACWWRDRALEALAATGRKFRVVYTSESVAGVMAAIDAGIAIGLLGESSLKDDFVVLSKADGFAAMPDSKLVLHCRDGLEAPLATAMVTAIKEAFANPLAVA